MVSCFTLPDHYVAIQRMYHQSLQNQFTLAFASIETIISQPWMQTHLHDAVCGVEDWVPDCPHTSLGLLTWQQLLAKLLEAGSNSSKVSGCIQL